MLLFFPLKGKNRNYGRGQEEIILFLWKLPNTGSESGTLNSISIRAKTGTVVTTNPLIPLMKSNDVSDVRLSPGQNNN